MPLVLNEAEVKSILTMPMALDALDASFQRLADGTAILHPRRRLHVPKRSYLHYMAAADGASGYLGMKVYTSSKGGLRFVVLLFQADSGDLLALIEADYLGQVRTGAASGIATRLLARADAKTVGMAGTGLQARTQLEAIAYVRKIESVRAYSRKEEHREDFARTMSAQLGIRVTPVATAEEAIRGTDIVVAATTASQPVIEGKWLAPGVHINAIGANFAEKTELDAAAVLRADRIVADSIEQSREEAGDLIQAFGGDESRWDEVEELANIVAGKAPGRTSGTQVTLFKSNGIATEDISVAGRIFEIAKEKGIGRWVGMWGDSGREAEARGL